MVRNGESASLVLVLPKRGWLAFCEYCAVAKKRPATTPFQFATNRCPGVSWVSLAVASMVIGNDGRTLVCRRSRYCTCTVWLVIGVAVTFSSQRCWSSACWNAAAVCGSVRLVSLDCVRPAKKNQARSRRIGPPNVPS